MEVMKMEKDIIEQRKKKLEEFRKFRENNLFNMGKKD